MARVVWPDEVIDQLDQIVAYIDVFDPPASVRLREKLFSLGQSLETFPRRGRPAPGNTRELTTVPPYVLRYDVVEDVVTILDVRHGARRPRD